MYVLFSAAYVAHFCLMLPGRTSRQAAFSYNIGRIMIVIVERNRRFAWWKKAVKRSMDWELSDDEKYGENQLVFHKIILKVHHKSLFEEKD